MKGVLMGDFQLDIDKSSELEYSNGKLCPRCKKPIQNDSRTCIVCLLKIRGKARDLCNKVAAAEKRGNLDQVVLWLA